MIQCPYCGYTNYEYHTECRKCQGPLTSTPGTVYPGKSYRIGPARARAFRSQALALLVLGLLIKVYWGGYGPWPVIDYQPWADLRPWLEPLFLYGGTVAYAFGWILHFV